MKRKLKILKAVLLLRKFNRYESKEKQIARTEKHYSNDQINEWIEWLKNPQFCEFVETDTDVEKENLYTSCTEHDYSPSNPWDAPGMSLRDFI